MPRPTTRRDTAPAPRREGTPTAPTCRPAPSGASRLAGTWGLEHKRSRRRVLTLAPVGPCGLAKARLSLPWFCYPFYALRETREHRDPAAARRAVRQVQEVHAGR